MTVDRDELFGLVPQGRLPAPGSAEHGRLQQLLEILGGSGDSGAIPVLLPFLLGSDESLVHVVTTSLEILLAGLRGRDLQRLDRDLRERSGYQHPLGWAFFQLERPEFGRLLRRAGRSFAVTALATLHPNGFVRETALRELMALRDVRSWPFLLLRLDDWVPVIQALAIEAIHARLGTPADKILAQQVPLLMRLAACERTAGTGLLRRVQEFLQGPGGRDLLLAACGDEDPAVRRACLSWLIDSGEGGGPDLLERALLDDDPIVRLLAARGIARFLPASEEPRFLGRLRGDRSAAVRRQACRWLQRLRPEAVRETWEAVLFDRQAGLREEARFHLARVGMTGFSELYKTSLSGEEHPLPVLLGGLGETGGPAEAALVKPFLAHPRAGVARGAVRAFARLAGRDGLPLLLETLRAGRPGPATEAARMVRPHLPLVDPEDLLQDILDAPEPWRQARLLSLLAQRGKWEALSPLLRLAALPPGPELGKRLLLAFQRWLRRANRSFVPPPAAKRESWKEELRSALPFLGPELGNPLAFHLSDGTLPFDITPGAPTMTATEDPIQAIKAVLELIPAMRTQFGIKRNSDSEADPLLYAGVAESNLIPQLTPLVESKFGPAYKAAGEGAFWKNWFDGFVKQVGGVRAEQTLFRKVITPTLTLYCAFWPWGSNPVKTSIRIGLLCGDDDEESRMGKALKGSF